MDKRGDFTGKSVLWLLATLIFLYVALVPFGFLPFPFSIEIGESLLRILIGVAGIVIFISSFNYESHQKFIGIVVGLLFVIAGVYIYIMGLDNPPFSLPFVFEINNVFLQVILIFYSLYLAYVAFKQD